jgi:nicotinamide-nucleotide adenylyltransferase
VIEQPHALDNYFSLIVDMPNSSGPDMRQYLSKYASAVTSFASSSSNLRILHSTPSASHPPPKTLYILDSSFNPPTVAHLRIATSALLTDSKPSPAPKRLLLLLATQNADKAPKPAPFEHRLAMMQLFASDLISSLSPSEAEALPGLGVDIAVTKLPYFIDKSAAIEESGVYPKDAQQVHLTGFDTLIRILDPKYYDPKKKLGVLEPFFTKNKLRVTYRTDDDWGVKAAQDEYLDELVKGRRDVEGGKREWVTNGRIKMCEGKKDGEEVISSTKARSAAKKGDQELLAKLVTKGVAEWILTEGPYTQE